MIDNIYVPETPWGSLGTKLEDPSNDSSEIIEQLGQTFQVDCEEMKTELLGHIPSYYAVYRTDTAQLLSVINHYPTLVQNENMFTVLEYLMPDEAKFECGGAIGHGQKVFGVFKLKQREKIVDDDVDSYVIVVNDHTKSDGKITIINSPIRLVCMNMIQHALSASRYMYRVPCTDDITTNRNIGQAVFENALVAVQLANKHAEKLLKVKIDTDTEEKIFDNLFPYEMSNEGEILPNKANETTSLKRDTFESCLRVDNLSNYAGTGYQYYQAMLDYTQHYFTNVNHAYDLNKRMNNVPGIGTAESSSSVKKLLNMIDKIAV